VFIRQLENVVATDKLQAPSYPWGCGAGRREHGDCVICKNHEGREVNKPENNFLISTAGGG
jgi:hypothetical protein